MHDFLTKKRESEYNAAPKCQGAPGCRNRCDPPWGNGMKCNECHQTLTADDYNIRFNV